MQNPNSYDDAAYLALTTIGIQPFNLPNILRELWEAGADLTNLEDEIGNCLSEILESEVSVDIKE